MTVTYTRIEEEGNAVLVKVPNTDSLTLGMLLRSALPTRTLLKRAVKSTEKWSMDYNKVPVIEGLGRVMMYRIDRNWSVAMTLDHTVRIAGKTYTGEQLAALVETDTVPTDRQRDTHYRAAA